DDNYVYTDKILGLPDTTPAGSPYYYQWCQDAAEILKVATNNSFYASSYNNEVGILAQAIDDALDVVNSKHFYYFATSLEFVRTTASKIRDPKHRVLYLRSSVQDALEDVRLFDIIGRSGDHRAYVQETVRRGLREAFKSDPSI